MGRNVSLYIRILVLCSGDLLPRVVFRMGVLAYLRSLALKRMCSWCIVLARKSYQLRVHVSNRQEFGCNKDMCQFQVLFR